MFTGNDWCSGGGGGGQTDLININLTINSYCQLCLLIVAILGHTAAWQLLYYAHNVYKETLENDPCRVILAAHVNSDPKCSLVHNALTHYCNSLQLLQYCNSLQLLQFCNSLQLL